MTLRILTVSAVIVMSVSACGRVPDPAAPLHMTGSCWQCHGDRYLASTAPDHVASDLPETCEMCHSTLGWTPAEAGDHDRYWPLTGQHVVATCASCHTDNVYSGTPRECVGCHRPDFVATTNPDHEVGGYPEACEVCHDTQAWRPAVFGSHDQYWPLRGQHVETTCASCHVDGVYAGTPRECVGCHRPDFVATTDPDHEVGGYPETCEACHTEVAWRPATFASHDQYWPLRGQHVETTCASCHVDGVYAGTPRECVGCHRPDFVATTDPDHEVGGYPEACEACHSEAAWRPASFESHDQFWPLLGAHQVAICASCHSDGVYAGTPRICVGCHREDYDTSANPPHVDLALATTCEGCHNETAWTTDRFPVHDQLFPISSGNHRGYACTDCHTAPEVEWARFTCTGCHEGEHQLARMNLKHDEVNNYAQTLTTYGVEGGCYHCHADGDE